MGASNEGEKGRQPRNIKILILRPTQSSGGCGAAGLPNPPSRGALELGRSYQIGAGRWEERPDSRRDRGAIQAGETIGGVHGQLWGGYFRDGGGIYGIYGQRKLI